MLGMIKSDLKKSLFSITFVISVIALLVLILSSPCGYDEYLDKSIFQRILENDKDLWKTDASFSDLMIFQAGFQGHWLSVFLPCITAFAFVPVFCDEYNSGYWRFNVVRNGRKKYLCSKFFSQLIVSSLVIITGYVIFAVICFSIFPHITEYPPHPVYGEWVNRISFHDYFNTDSCLFFVCARVFTSLFVANTGALLCLILSAFLMNKYASVSIPVIVYFFCRVTALNKIFSENTDKYSKLFWLDNSSRFAAAEIYFPNYWNKPFYFAYIYFIVVQIVLFFLFYYVMKRRLRQ